MSLFNELKRRNVFRVGLAYVVAAWLIMQVSDVVLNNIEAPGWVFKVIMLVLAIGLPLILLLAWAFEMTPEGLKREKDVDRQQSITPQTGKKLDRVIIGVLTVALAYFVFDKFSPDAPAPVSVTETATPTAPEMQGVEKSIAVLPLANRSNREEDQFFTDGIHDDLLTQLAKIADLKVISRTSVMRYRDTELPIPEIAAQLGVTTILEGGIQRSGDHVRINMQLIEADTDKHLWAETYDRQLTAENLFAIQSEITRSITTALKATLTPDEIARIEEQPTDNLGAMQEYMKGQQLLALRTGDAINQAKVHFETALELDPDFAKAIVGLANALHLQQEYVGLPDSETLVPAMELVNQALAISPQLGEAYIVRAELLRHDKDFDESEADFRRAMELIPGNATIYHWFALLKYDQEMEDEGNQLMRQAHRLDPMSRVIHYNVAILPFYDGRDEESLAELQRVSMLHPDYPTPYSFAAWIHWVHGDMVENLRATLKVIELDPNNPSFFHCFSFWGINAMEAAAQCFDNYQGRFAAQRAFLQVVHPLGLGDRDTALAAFESFPNDDDGASSWQIRAAMALGLFDFAKEYYVVEFPGWFDGELPLSVPVEDLDNAIHVAHILSREGETERAVALLKAALETMQPMERARGPDSIGFDDVQVYALLGLREPALAALEEIAEMEFLRGWQNLKFHPVYDSIRGDPRFTAALNKLNNAAERARATAVAEGLL